MSFDLRKKDSTMYVKLNNIFDKVLKLDDVPLDINFDDSTEQNKNRTDISPTEMDYLLKLVSKSVMENVDEKDLTKEEITKTIFDKQIRVTKITYTLTAANYKKISKSILENLKEDQEALKILSKTSGQTIDQVKDELTNMYKEIELNVDEFADQVIDVYIDNKYELVGLEISTKEGKNLLTYSHLDTRYNVKFNVMENLITLDYNSNEPKTIKLDTNVEGNDISLQIIVANRSTNNDLNEEYTINAKYGTETLTATIKVKLNNRYEMTDLDYANAVTPESLTEAETQEISDKLAKNPITNMIVEKIRELLKAQLSY